MKKGVERMKRFVCGFLCLCLLWTGLSFAAAEEENPGDAVIPEETGISEEELEEIQELDADEPIERVTGKVYPVPTLADFNMNSPALYTCSISAGNPYIFKDMDPNMKNYAYKGSGTIKGVEVLYVGLRCMILICLRKCL